MNTLPRQARRCVFSPVCGDGARRGVVSTRRNDVGEGDHVVLRVLASLLPADGAAGVWEPLLHTHTQKRRVWAGWMELHKKKKNGVCSGTMVLFVHLQPCGRREIPQDRRCSVPSANIKLLVLITSQQEICSWTSAWKRRRAAAQRSSSTPTIQAFHGVSTRLRPHQCSLHLADCWDFKGVLF